MNYLQSKLKINVLNVLVDIKHSYFYNGKLYVFLTFQFLVHIFFNILFGSL